MAKSRKIPGDYRALTLAHESFEPPLPAPVRIGLGYPASYSVAASSLGYLTVYKTWNDSPDLSCERFFTDMGPRGPFLLESGDPIRSAHALAFSVACETETAAVAKLLQEAGLSPLAKDRRDDDPPVIIGGPITTLDPRIVAPLADLIVHGDGEDALAHLAQILAWDPKKDSVLGALDGDVSGIWLCSTGDPPPPFAHAANESLPALAPGWSKGAQLRDLFLIEASRGCSRGCGFCVMSGRAGRGSGIRPVAADQILELTPKGAPGVGLVGAAVSDHPEITRIVETLVDRGQRVSLSSLRADRLSKDLMENLVRGGLKSLTLAADGSSEEIRRNINKGITEDHLTSAAALAASKGVSKLKLYSMIGLPNEQDEDVLDFARLLIDLSKQMPVQVSVQAFVPKPNTPLENHTMAPLGELKHKMNLLKKTAGKRVRLHPSSPRWAWVDWKLAHMAEGASLAALLANEKGGTFAAWKAAIKSVEEG